MYTAFFGLKEKPFRLVPDPDFLFLGTSHEEALAHLTYAVSQQEGFVEVTGEVGTGKTTLCRSFLEDLDQTVESAFIFNSKLNADQLLKAVLAELDIDCPNGDSADMTHALYEFLLKKKIQGKTVILLIDEAQNLSRETLEQLRMLSNLETTRNKLLQIILVGQPELTELLNSHDMRQLRQRISLSCRIMPLSRMETGAYIAHRVNRVSLKSRSLFSSKAVDAIYRYSKGIPRLINILCDRSLVAAFGVGKTTVFPDMVQAAFQEVDVGQKCRPGFMQIPWPSRFRIYSGTTVMVCLCLAFLFFAGPLSRKPASFHKNSAPGALNAQSTLLPPDLPEDKSGSIQDTLSPTVPAQDSLVFEISAKNDIPAQALKPVPEPLTLPDPFPVISGKSQVISFLTETLPAATRETVFSVVLSLWENLSEGQNRYFDNAGQDIGDARYFEVRSMQHRLNVLHLSGPKDQIKIFNLPAILTFSIQGKTGYLAVIGLENDNLCTIACDNARRGIKVDFKELKPFLGEDIFIVWKDIFGYSGVISPSAPPAAVISLKLVLEQLGFKALGTRPLYDAPLVNAVKIIQTKHGLLVDGVVGAMTKMILFQELEAQKRQNRLPVGLSSRISGTKEPK